MKPGTAEGIKVTEILQTGVNSWGETDMAAINAGKAQFNEGIDLEGPVPIAAFAGREIAVRNTTQDKDHDKEQEPDVTKKSAKRANLMVIGDSDFASNQYFKFSGNGDLFLNTASYLAEEENLISIRPKERKNTPLTLTRAQGVLIFTLGTIIIPACTLFVGARSWWRRRRL